MSKEELIEEILSENEILIFCSIENWLLNDTYKLNLPEGR